ncbi:MAG TPA: TetR/AcrR family transcriptional regulator [Myxococcota bacterium]|nr:TetR/AcrR family transcriptional regulator [Myxococcota bacterium]
MPARRAKRKTYHHGALREALVTNALELLDAGGREAVNVREAARRAGVSPGAPFRHFPDRAALLAALTSEIGAEFRAFSEDAIARAGANPLRQFRAMGLAYIRYAIEHPRRFQLLHAETCTDPHALALFTRDAEAVALIARAQREGFLRAGPPEAVHLAAQALTYGLARMIVDGHLPRAGAEALAEQVLDVFGRGVAAPR